MDTLFWQDEPLTEEQENKYGSALIPARAASVSPAVAAVRGVQAPAVPGGDVREEDYDKDILLLEYPNKADKIRKFREYGISDMTIRRKMADREARMRAWDISPETIDRKLGRTAQTKTEAIDQSRRQKARAFADIAGMTPEEADVIIAVADYGGVSPNLLFADEGMRDAAFKALENQGVKVSAGWAEQFRDSVKAQQLADDKYAAGFAGWLAGRDPFSDAYILDIDAQLEKLAPPLAQTSLQKVAAGAGQFGTQQYQNVRAGGAAGVASAVAGGAVGFAIGGPPMAATLAKGAGRLGFGAGAGVHMMQQEIAMAYEEFLGIEGVDPKLAWAFAGIFGAASGAIEFAEMRTFLGAIAPNRVFQNRVMAALASAGISYGKEIGQEVAQRGVVVIGRELLKYTSGLENAPAGEIAGELAEEGIGAAYSFAAPFALGGAVKASAAYAGGRVTSPGRLNKIARAEMDSLMQATAGLRLKIASGQDGEAFVFVPKGDVDALFQTSEEGEEIRTDERVKALTLKSLGVDPETYDSAAAADEIAIPAEKFDASPIESENVRRGVRGETAREELARIQADIDDKLADPLYADTKEAEEALGVKKEVEKMALDAGADPSVAVQGSGMWAAHAVIMAREMGIPVKDAMRLIVQRASQEMEDAAARGEIEQGVYRQRGAGDEAGNDAKYFAALESGDMEAARKIVDNQARKKGYISDADYRMNHRAPNSHDEDVTVRIDKVKGSDLVPADYWTTPRHYQYESYDYESFYAIREALEKPYPENNKGKGVKDRYIQMFRAVPKTVKESEFRNGDWITPSRKYAAQEGAEIPGGYRIIAKKVQLKDIWWDGNSINEFGFDDGSEYAYANTKNNRKLNDVIARDYSGNIVPPSERFNSRKSETHYQRGNLSAEENVRRGTEAMERVISEHVGVENAMWREGIEWISFVWGRPGKGANFKGGYGVSHIIEKRNAEGHDGLAIARKMVDVIANGGIGKPYQEHDRTKINIDYDGYRAVLTQVVHGNKRTWLTSGFSVESENAKSDAASGEYGPVMPGATLSGSTRPETREGADLADSDSLPPAGEIFKQLDAANGNQAGRVTRGMFHVDPETGNRIVTLFKAKNRSTFIHEIGHAFLEDLQMMAAHEGASGRVRSDWETVRDWLGMGEQQERPTREQHEKFADGLLNYVDTGLAPSKALRGAFIRIKNWLRELFAAGEIQRVEMSDEVRRVYARLMAAPEDVDAAYRERSSMSDTDAQVTAAREDADATRRLLDALNDPASLDSLIARMEDEEAGVPEPDAGETAAAVAEAVRGQMSEWDRIFQEHELALAEPDNPGSRGGVIGVIKANGFIDYRKVRDRHGAADATRLRKKLGPGLFRKDGLGLDEFVAVLEGEGARFESGDEIFALLMSDEGANRALSEAYRKGVEKGREQAERFLEAYDAWAAAAGKQGDGEMLKAGHDAIETIMKLRARSKEDTRTIADLSRRVGSLMSNLTKAREDARADAERADSEQARRSERELERDIFIDAADRLLGRNARQEDRISALKALLSESKKETRDDAKAIKAYGRFVDELLDENEKLGEKATIDGIKAEIREERLAEAYGKKIDRLLGKNAKLKDRSERQKDMISALRILLRHEESRHKIADGLAARLKTKLESLKEKEKLQRAAKRMIGQMARAAKDRKVSWERREEIKEIMAAVNTRDRYKETSRKASPRGVALAGQRPVETKDGVRYKATDAARRNAIETLISLYGEAEGGERALEAGFTKRDMELLKLSSMDAVSFEELEAVHEEITALRDVGKRELSEQKAIEKEKVRLETGREMTELRKGTAGRAPVILGAGEGKKRYSFAAAKQDAIRREQAMGMAALEDEIMNGLELSQEERDARVNRIHAEAADRIGKDFAGNIRRGLKRKWDFLPDHVAMVLADRQRLFDLLDGGSATFKGPFVRFWVAHMNECEDEMQRAVNARIGEPFETKMRKLGLSKIKLYKQAKVPSAAARAFFGAKYPTKANLIGFYVLSKNPDARRSIVSGNFSGVPGAERLIDECIAQLTDAEKALGDFIFADISDRAHFERAQRAAISVLGEGMDELESYVRIFRVERNPYVSEIDKQTALTHADSRGRPARVEPGFTHSRVRDSSAIETDIFKVWTRHVREEEHFIAYGAALKQARAMLFEPDPSNPNRTMARAINEKYGSYVFSRVIEEYNRLAFPDILRARGEWDAVIGRFAATRAVAVLAYNVSTYLKNFASIPKWFIEAHPADVMASLADFASGRKGFYERVYATDPQIARRKGSYIQNLMSQEAEQAKTKLANSADTVAEIGMEPNAVIDRWTAAIMFDSVYRSGLRRNLTSERARSEAQLAVQRLLQPSSARELPPLFSRGGPWRILLMFMSEPVKNFNIVAYDIPRQVANGDYARAARGAFAIGLSAVIVKMLAEGFPSSGEGDGEEEKESWSKWLFEAVMDGFVGQVPVLGTEVMDAIQGKTYSKDHTIVSEPFWQMWYGVRKIIEGAREEDDGGTAKLMRNGYTKKEWGTLAMLNGFANLTGAPFTQFQRLWLSRDAKGVADWMLVNMGNRKALERAQRNARERNAASF
ncbi:MAG: hypothetical protein LBL73_01065 [Synergistaceae bacterium]|jgi:hypothetical protein|nr:hypothetical protein [Synergistaceae bacterium]